MKIRFYKKEDFNEIQSWWIKAGETAPILGQLPEDSTFVLEKNGVMIACVSAYLTNCKEIAYIENLAKDPDLGSYVTKEMINNLIDHTFNFIKELGYKRAICFAYVDKLKERYLEFGFHKTCDNLSSFSREL